jgi:hypothetical protein
MAVTIAKADLDLARFQVGRSTPCVRLENRWYAVAAAAKSTGANGAVHHPTAKTPVATINLWAAPLLADPFAGNQEHCCVGCTALASPVNLVAVSMIVAAIWAPFPVNIMPVNIMKVRQPAILQDAIAVDMQVNRS